MNDVQKEYESVQRFIFLAILVSGCCIFIFGIITLNYPAIMHAIHWAGILGFGLMIFGFVGVYLTNPDHISKVSKEQEIIERETNHRVSVTVYVSNPYEAVLVFVFFLISSTMMCFGVVQLFNWIGTFF